MAKEFYDQGWNACVRGETYDMDAEQAWRDGWLDCNQVSPDLRTPMEDPPPLPPKLTEDQIKRMVSRFLGWKLPKHFRPDAGISFKAEFNENTPWPMKHEPTGTNLFDATQADAMVRYMVEGMPANAPNSNR
jgi:hypothetical protein